jgi:hypothetical protein
MEKLKALATNFHQSPVKTALGLVAGAAAWLALRPEVEHLTLQGAGSVALAAALAVWGGVSQDSSPK